MTHIMFEVKIEKKWVMIPKEDRVWKSVTQIITYPRFYWAWPSVNHGKVDLLLQLRRSGDSVWWHFLLLEGIAARQSVWCVNYQAVDLITTAGAIISQLWQHFLLLEGIAARQSAWWVNYQAVDLITTAGAIISQLWCPFIEGTTLIEGVLFLLCMIFEGQGPCTHK